MKPSQCNSWWLQASNLSWMVCCLLQSAHLACFLCIAACEGPPPSCHLPQQFQILQYNIYHPRPDSASTYIFRVQVWILQLLLSGHKLTPERHFTQKTSETRGILAQIGCRIKSWRYQSMRRHTINKPATIWRNSGRVNFKPQFCQPLHHLQNRAVCRTVLDVYADLLLWSVNWTAMSSLDQCHNIGIKILNRGNNSCSQLREHFFGYVYNITKISRLWRWGSASSVSLEEFA